MLHRFLKSAERMNRINIMFDCLSTRTCILSQLSHADTWFCRSVDVYRCPELELLCKIQVHRKLVNVIRWHPEYTAQSQELSPCRFWLATGSNEAMVSVVNLQNVLGNKDCLLLTVQLNKVGR